MWKIFFTYQEREIQLDLPHSLMDKLGLKKGEDITQPLYLDPKVLDRSETYKGITLQEGEIILVNPNKIVMKDQEIQIDLTSAGIKDLENTIAEQTRQIQAKDREITDLRNQLTQKDTQISTLQTNYNNANNRANNLQTQLNTANVELAKERGWWDKWMSDLQEFIHRVCLVWPNSGETSFFIDYEFSFASGRVDITTPDEYKRNCERQRLFKKRFKENVYQYYRDK